MKKILLTSLLAMIVAAPAFAAGETPTYGTGANTALDAAAADALTSADTTATPVGYVAVTDTDKAAVATAAYVKGAYNALGGAIDENAKDIATNAASISAHDTLLGDTTLTTTATTVTGAIEELKGSISETKATIKAKEVAAFINWGDGDTSVSKLDVTDKSVVIQVNPYIDEPTNIEYNQFEDLFD